MPLSMSPLRRATMALVLALSASPCMAATRVALGDLIDGAPATKTVTTLRDLRYRDMVRQKYDFSCGSAALASVLRYGYGVDAAEPAMIRSMLVGNDPKDAGVKQVAQIRFGPEGAASARLVKAHVPQAVYLNDKRKGDTVDLVVGAAWKSFGKVPVVATPTQTLRQCPTITVQP